MSRYSDFKEWWDGIEKKTDSEGEELFKKVFTPEMQQEMKADVDSGEISVDEGCEAVTAICYAVHATTELQTENEQLLARVAELEAGQQWQPASTAPKDGKFLIGVWLGDWNNPQQSFVVMEARFFQGAIYWEKNDWRYRTEEGGVYDVVGWMPRPQSPEGGQS